MSVSYETVFKCIDSSVHSLTYRWKIFCELFDSGEDNIKLLNSSGAAVFGLMQRLMLDDAILHLSRLTDPASSGKNKDNASLKYLVELAKGHLDVNAVAGIEAKLSKLEAHVSSVRVHRMKALAHADLNHATKTEALPEIRYDDLEAAMQLCRELVMELGTTNVYRTGYAAIIPFGKGPDTLFRVLRAEH